MTNRILGRDGFCFRRLTCVAQLAALMYAAMILGCAENSSSEPRVDAAAAKALRAKLLGDEAPAARSSE